MIYYPLNFRQDHAIGIYLLISTQSKGKLVATLN